jgi:hypothetical protein
MRPRTAESRKERPLSRAGKLAGNTSTEERMMTTTTTEDQTLTRDELRSLHALASKLEEEAKTCRLGGLEDRAEKLEAEVRQIHEKIQAAREANEEEGLAALREKNRMRERHERQERERQEREARQTAAKEWMRSHQWHGDPVDTVATLRAASEAGIAAGDLLAVCTRVRRRKGGQDCLTVHSYLRRDYLPVNGP